MEVKLHNHEHLNRNILNVFQDDFFEQYLIQTLCSVPLSNRLSRLISV